jgi:hypothetical protein
MDILTKSFINLLIDSCPTLVSAVQYGNQDEAQDVDILIIQSDEPKATVFSLGRIDCLCLSTQEYSSLLDLWDPTVTEPILTGTQLYGTPKWLEQQRTLLHTLPFNTNTIQHLQRESARHFLATSSFLNNPAESIPTSKLLWILINFSFAVSYGSFCTFYCRQQDKKSPVTLNELTRVDNYLNEILTYKSSAKRNPMLLDHAQLNQMVDRWCMASSSQ